MNQMKFEMMKKKQTHRQQLTHQNTLVTSDTIVKDAVEKGMLLQNRSSTKANTRIFSQANFLVSSKQNKKPMEHQNL